MRYDQHFPIVRTVAQLSSRNLTCRAYWVRTRHLLATKLPVVSRVTVEEQQKAQLRLREKTRQMRSQRAELGVVQQQASSQRVSAVLQLKANIDAVRKRLALHSSLTR